MSIFIQEVLGLLNRNQKKVTLDKAKDWFEFGKLYQSSSLNNKSAYTPRMDPFVIKWGDFICQATEDMTRTLPGQGNLGFIPVYTDPSGSCNWDTLKDSIITQNALNTIINIAGGLVVAGDVAINGCDLTSTCTSFNLLNQPTTITFGSGAANIFISRPDPTSTVTIVGTQDSNACTNGALVVSGGVGIAKNLFVCGNANITGDAAINGGDLTSTASNFNLLQQSSTIGFGYTSQLIAMGGISATSVVSINGTKESTSCSTGAFVVNGGVGIAKSLFVCGSINVSGTSNLNGDVYLGDTLGDQIQLTGTLLDNNGNASLINQALVGTGTGAATWQNVALVGEVCAVNSIPLWTPNSSTLGCSLIYQNGNNATPATKIFLKGGLASEGSQVRTITDVALGYGNYAGGENSAAFNFRSSALGNDSFAAGHKGIAGGHGSFAAGYNTGAGNYGFGLFLTTATTTTIIINLLSGSVAAGDFIVANVDTDPSIRYEILSAVTTGTPGNYTITIATPISVNIGEAFAIEEAVPDRGDNTGAVSLGYWAASKGSGAVAIGTRATTDVVNQIAIGSSFSTVKLDGTVQDDTQNKVLVIDGNNVVRWRSSTTLGMTSFNVNGDSGVPETITNGETFYINGDGANISTASNGTNSVSVSLDDTTVVPGTYTNATFTVDQKGRLTSVSNTGISKQFTALISQVGVLPPTMIILQNDYPSITWTFSYISPGLYTLQASQNIFTNDKTVIYVTPDVVSGKPYCAAAERSTDSLLLLNTFDTGGASDNNFFDKATFKFEVFN